MTDNHVLLSWTACYDDLGKVHKSSKEGLEIVPKKERESDSEESPKSLRFRICHTLPNNPSQWHDWRRLESMIHWH